MLVCLLVRIKNEILNVEHRHRIVKVVDSSLGLIFSEKV